MRVAIGTDHAGFPLKAEVVQLVQGLGHTIEDCGAYTLQPGDDYPDFARKVGEALVSGKAERGVVICGSGVGASVAATKVPGVRAAMCHDTFSAHQGVEDDDMNVVCMGARVIGPALAGEIVQTFLAAKFSGAERHTRRLGKVNAIETDARKGVFDR